MSFTIYNVAVNIGGVEGTCDIGTAVSDGAAEAILDDWCIENEIDKEHLDFYIQEHVVPLPEIIVVLDGGLVESVTTIDGAPFRCVIVHDYDTPRDGSGDSAAYRQDDSGGTYEEYNL